MTKVQKTKGGVDLLSGAWRVVAFLFFIGILNYLDRSMITTMRESIVTAIPMSDAQFGLLTSIFLWVYGILSPFAGYLADRFNRSRVIIISLFIWSGVTFLTAFAKTYEQLLITRALMGISEACFVPAGLALIMDYHKGSTRSTATGINIAGMMTGSSLGFIGGWIAEHHHWSDAFGIFGIVGVFYAFVLSFVLKDPPRSDGKEIFINEENPISFRNGMKSLLSNRSFILLLIFWGLSGMVSWIVMGWLPTYYQQHFNLSQTMAGLYATGYLYPAAFIGLLLGGFLADRWSKTNSRGRIYIPVIGLCIAAPTIFWAGSTPMVYIAVICFFLYALTQKFSDTNLMPVLCMIADKRYRATGYGILNLFSTVIGGIGIYVGGYLRDVNINLSKLFQFTALIVLLCSLLLLLIKPKVKSYDEY